MKKYIYVFKFYPQYEQSMALCEFEQIFHKPYEKYHFSDLNYDYTRSVFIKERITLFYAKESVEEIIESLIKDQLQFDEFKITYYKNDITHVDYQQSLKWIQDLSDPIIGEPNIKNPQIELILTKIKNIYYFGLIERNKKWHQYEVKPYSYSHSLPLKVARTTLNLAIGDRKNLKIIDPCCGVGTVVLEGLSMNENIIGSDINRDVSYKGRLNLKHFGYDPLLITRKDIHDIQEHYDLSILDVPYGVYAPFPVEKQLDLISEARRISDRLAVITHIDLTQDIIKIGYKLENQCIYQRGNFKRYITICQREDL